MSITMSQSLQKYVLLLLRLGLGLLFIYASFDKILNPGAFAKSIANYRILPVFLLHITAIVLPWLELVAGIALVSNRFPRGANMLIGLMTTVFTIAILSAMARGLDINCGCFSVVNDENNMNATKVIQNIGIILGAVVLELRFRRSIVDR